MSALLLLLHANWWCCGLFEGLHIHTQRPQYAEKFDTPPQLPKKGYTFYVQLA